MFSKILVPVDMSSPEPGARSCVVARKMQDDWNASIRLFSVIPGYSMPLVAAYFPKDAMQKMEHTVTEDLKTLASHYFDKEPEIVVTTGKRSQEILTMSEQWNADLIVFGCRPKDIVGGELMLGSCGSTVAERAKCNVLIAR